MSDNILDLISEYAKTIKDIKDKGGKLFHTLEAISRDNPDSRRFEFSYPDWMGCYIAVYAHCNSCLFCKFMSDVWYDHNGPYMMLCDKGHKELILEEACKDFEPEEDKNGL